jgi:hypothetical protein
MKRAEIIANISVQEELFDFFAREKIVLHYTLFPKVHGAGTSDPKKGDAVWPEENFMLIVYCDEVELSKIKDVLHEVKKIFPDEGIKMFASDAEEIV